MKNDKILKKKKTSCIESQYIIIIQVALKFIGIEPNPYPLVKQTHRLVKANVWQGLC